MVSTRVWWKTVHGGVSKTLPVPVPLSQAGGTTRLCHVTLAICHVTVDVGRF